MPKIALVTDSTSNLPPALLEQYNIHVAPQVLIWDGASYDDGVDITQEQFYTRLKTSKTTPSTSQVTISNFHNIFSSLLEQDYQVLAVLIAETLSGTICSARQVVDEMLPHGAPVELVDSGTVSMAEGLLVLEVARAAAAGATLEECKQLAEKGRDNVGILFAVDTLEYLHRGGRIGGASRFLGTALNIKPILEVVNGHVEPVERVRTRTKSLSRLVDLLDERIAGRKPVHLAALNANAEAEANELLKIAAARFEAVDAISTGVSPVIGTHTGPGTVGIAYLAGF
jgi:DegV family protein with EDD domain